MTETTAQGLFDTIVAHLRAQKRQSSTVLANHSTPTCLYRGPDGLKCAVGAIITDEEYTPKMDDCENGQGIYELMNVNLFPIRLIPFSALLSTLQNAHDSDHSWNESGFTERGEALLAAAATEFGLTYTPPPAI